MTGAVRIFEFRILIAGLDLDDEVSLDTLITGFEGGASVGGTTTELVEVAITSPGDDPIAVVNEAIDHLAHLLPQVTVHGLDLDLVGISDIAQLTGKTRESIRLYADAKRGPGGFPAPVGVVGDAVRIWRWADVDEWLREHDKFSFPTVPVPSWAVDSLNASLRQRRQRRPAGTGRRAS